MSDPLVEGNTSSLERCRVAIVDNGTDTYPIRTVVVEKRTSPDLFGACGWEAIEAPYGCACTKAITAALLEATK